MTLPVDDPRLRLTPLETTWGMPVGPDPGTAPLSLSSPRPARGRPGGRSPLRAAVEAVVLPALRRPPCVVSFSGGRDSSTVLAVATAVARREGLPDPVPYSHRFPAVEDSREDGWQELVVRALGLSEWQRPTWTDELDVLGPHARTVLLRDGVLPPFNGHLHEPVFAAARGGSVLTGIGGDELFSQVSRYPVVRVAARRAPLRWRSAPHLLFSATAPRALRARRGARHLPVAYDWLRPPTARALRRAVALDVAAEPLRWDVAAATWTWPGRVLQLPRRAKERMAAAHDVLVEHPFACALVLAAAAATWGWAGPRGRAGELLTHFGDLLPRELFTRETKAGFNGAFWAGPAAEFARGWTGGGVDPDLVDPRALHAQWTSPEPDLHTLTLLQQVWLAQHRAG
ncbi:asparagine synthase (glutamine-hydrolyzing) [Kineococcus radiotolerans]|uniref:Asparagine synthase (Glutamine-hydrolyzing) n=1 Tax=Kineococcus radiotolerans TaxID=131568 RepID=A0A7W4XXI8_KINRA|nr:asparagine synthase-related protein [Kineococcus radiotolerans]MBB2901998.1 asparagine synthase (glutamine-hydrolyzing) [Kineococcus radiotolerans]